MRLAAGIADEQAASGREAVDGQHEAGGTGGPDVHEVGPGEAESLAGRGDQFGRHRPPVAAQHDPRGGVHLTLGRMPQTEAERLPTRRTAAGVNSLWQTPPKPSSLICGPPTPGATAGLSSSAVTIAALSPSRSRTALLDEPAVAHARISPVRLIWRGEIAANVAGVGAAAARRIIAGQPAEVDGAADGVRGVRTAVLDHTPP